MNETIAGTGAKTPWHVWVVGVLATLWNLGGAVDYTMTQTRNEAYLGQFTAEQLEYFMSFPAWFDAFWAIGVWGALLGSILILARSRFAYHAFVASLVGIAGTTFWTATNAMPESLDTAGMWAFTIAIVVSVVLLAFYSRRMTARGVLR